MEGIEKITARITEDMQAEIDAIERESARQAEEIRQKYEETAAREREAILSRGRAAATERAQRLAGMAAMEAKKQALAVKQEMLAQVFEQAREKLGQLPSEQYVPMLAALAAGASKSGREQVILSPHDKEHYGKAVVEEANKRLENGALTLAENTRAITGGLLLSQGDVEINCTFDRLIHQLRGELTPQVAHILFATE